jgi:hypothetical protein
VKIRGEHRGPGLWGSEGVVTEAKHPEIWTPVEPLEDLTKIVDW